MAEGHGRDRWARTSALAQSVARLLGVKRPPEIGPYRRERSDAVEVDPENISLLRQAFRNF